MVPHLGTLFLVSYHTNLNVSVLIFCGTFVYYYTHGEGRFSMVSLKLVSSCRVCMRRLTVNCNRSRLFLCSPHDPTIWKSIQDIYFVMDEELCVYLHLLFSLFHSTFT